MAKQSGLHQIKGKVDGYAYYRQSGVKTGLMRRINEGLSSRVKNGAEFANTRLNNAEFGNGADVAKVAASLIVPKYRPMFLNFSQAKLTKSILALIKQNTGNWGQRGLVATDVAPLCDGISALAKYPFSNLIDSVTATAGSTSGTGVIEVIISTDGMSTLRGLGADGFYVKCIAASIFAGQYSGDVDGYIKSLSDVNSTETNEESVVSEQVSMSFDLTRSAKTVTGATKLDVAILIVMPYRTINNQNHVLQEYCTFKAVQPIFAV